ncbi:Archaeal transcription factor E [Methanosarcina lacustris Z-7289]|uniref:Transcription factor E n=2 Tax=Methanosarcina lacustris TaxID=170861 RepID=A0A0E3S436_9EURY|nr:Archaeal transcription factor E [Methanosarcina lacustris Z-7289]
MSLVGEDGLKMIGDMPEGEITDEEIATKTGVLLNTVRRTLFILYENKFAIVVRERDSNSGWLTYLWHLDFSGIEHQLMREKKKLLRNLKTRLEFEDNNVFYTCPQGCVRLLFDEATETEFLCPMCGEDLAYYDNSLFVGVLKKRVDALNNI